MQQASQLCRIGFQHAWKRRADIQTVDFRLRPRHRCVGALDIGLQAVQPGFGCFDPGLCGGNRGLRALNQCFGIGDTGLARKPVLAKTLGRRGIDPGFCQTRLGFGKTRLCLWNTGLGLGTARHGFGQTRLGFGKVGPAGARIDRAQELTFLHKRPLANGGRYDLAADFGHHGHLSRSLGLTAQAHLRADFAGNRPFCHHPYDAIFSLFGGRFSVRCRLLRRGFDILRGATAGAQVVHQGKQAVAFDDNTIKNKRNQNRGDKGNNTHQTNLVPALL